jgi:PAT family beta-lactamase induction signal transducer AmpG
VVDILKTRRLWIWVMQLLIGGGLAGVALTIPASNFFQYTLAFLWLLAFSSATHDIAADGFYMLATTPNEQAFFVGIRSTFYRISMISGQGLLVILAGVIQSSTGLPKISLAVQTKFHTGATEEVRSDWLTPTPAETGDLRIIAQQDILQIQLKAGDPVKVGALLAQAKEWNTTNGFYRVQQYAKGVQATEKRVGWWEQYISGPLGAFLEKHFGSRINTTDKSKKVGNVCVSYLRLSKPPGKQIVVALALKSGDKSIALAEGARIVFDDSNWNKRALVVFQLDPELQADSTAIYEVRSGNIPLSWSVSFWVLVGLFAFFGIYHKFMLPRPASDRPGTANTVVAFLGEFFKTFGAFFAKDRIGVLLLFLLFYRFAEAQLVKLVTPFLLDGREVGGLGLTTGQVGFVYGTIGIIALTCGGLLGGMVASRGGLKLWLWPMVLIMHLPDAMFVYLAYAQPDNFAIINLCVAVEQFGYGFGFTAYMLYMIYIARGEHETAHYAICTGFMALGMMLPGMFSGWLQEIIGYQHFFVWVLLATIPGFVVVAFVPLDAQFGKKGAAPASP